MTQPAEPKESPALESTTLKKGLLWQQWDRFFSRWKERFFVLTRDYLACFKKGSSLGITEMGTFLYKVNLVDVQGLQWVDKKRDGVIAVKVGQDGQLLLWSAKGLDDWMFALRDAVSRSKGRREALRKAHTLIPQLSDSGLYRSSCFRRQAMTLQHTLSDSHVEKTLLGHSNSRDFQSSLRSTTEHQPTPHMGKRSQRISVLTDIVITGGEPDMDLAFDSELCLKPRNALGPRLAPQCAAGSHTSLVSLGAGARGMLFRPSPRSLQVSPALAQRSLYAQHVLSAPEIAGAPPELRQSRSAASNVVTSEFAFIRPDSPLSRSSHTNTASSTRSECYYQRSHSTPQAVASNSLPHNAAADTIYVRPSSIYGQPSVLQPRTEKTPPPQFYIAAQQPDVVPQQGFKGGHAVVVKPVRRPQRRYMHSKSDHSFVNATDKIVHVPSSNGERQGSLAYR